jgi:large subunit ribosomal protein L15
MMIHDITKKVGAYPDRIRVGRGRGSGKGKTSGRGQKGARSRSGWSSRAGYEGGQGPLIRRIPKRGFSNAAFRTTYHVINIKALDAHFDNGDEVTPQDLVKAGVIRDTKLALKVLGEGELTKKLTVSATRFSASAKSKIEAAGGAVVIIPGPKKWTRTHTDQNEKQEKKAPATA